MGLIEQWNIAEQRIKRAEQVRGNEIVAAAIFELRYAGRKIVDSIELVLNFDIGTNLDKRAAVLNFVADATEDCVKSKHDAIDAMLNFVTSWFDDIEKKVGPEQLQTIFPEYLKVLGLIAGIQERIAESRADRNRLRDAIYNRIDGEEYERILNLFVTMKNSQDRVTLIAQKNRDKARKEALWKYILLAAGLSGWVTLLIGQYRQSSFPFDANLFHEKAQGSQLKSGSNH
ncbi:hypothetical protein [Methylobacterium sp. WL116]|uniref:hypothetical protein n=1 Tax=Methylobacterium sp. WL116 TaxID=2603889 RepID=UPI0011CCA9AE|nr:hypothetical protein [Methylobacterium sp. WL116]TXM92019.1 hypothetical protein FV223_13250 [Methylobacterium sp. WL116]